MHENITLIHDSRHGHPFTITLAGTSICDGTYKITRKNSNTYCFEYIYEGTGTVCLDGKVFNPSAGDVYWLPAGHNHLYYSSAEKPWKKIWFNINGSFTEDVIKNYNLQNINHIPCFEKPELFEEFLSIINSGKDHAKITDECTVVFLKIIQQLSEHIHSLSLTDKDLPSSAAYNLKRRIDLLNSFDISMDILAEEIYCTKSHAIRTFKKSYGITPYQYLLKRKLKDAKTMLADTNYSIKEISDFLQFKDPHSFTQFFKKETGMSPSGYRKQKH